MMSHSRPHYFHQEIEGNKPMESSKLAVGILPTFLTVLITLFCVSSAISQNTPTLTLMNPAVTSKDGPTSITYGNLFKDGTTSVKDIDPDIVGPLPKEYRAYSKGSYDIRTTVVASGPHIVTFYLPSVADQKTFNSLRILHSEPDDYDRSRAVWVDRTILSSDSPAPNFADRKIYARVNEVGPFMIASYTPLPLSTNIVDLSVSIMTSPDPAIAGDRLTYTINVTNFGPNAATEAVLVDGMSADAGFISATPAQGECRYDSGTLMCKLGTIQPRTIVSIRVVTQLRENPSPRDGKTAIASLIFVRANEKDSDDNNNQNTNVVKALPKRSTAPVR